MANLPEKNITTVDKITSIPINTNIFINANGEFRQASIDNVVKSSSVVSEAVSTAITEATTESINNQFNTATGTTILATSTAGNIVNFKGYGKSEQTQYSGKNKLDVPSSVDVSASGYVFLNKAIDLKAGVEYKFTFISSISQGPQTQFGMNYVDGTNENLSTLGTTAGQITKQTFTPTKDVASVTYYSYNAMTVTNCMISLATEDDTYEPYVGGTASPNPSYKQRINAVGDKGWFDGELLSGVYSTSNGIYGANANYLCNKNPMPCKANDEVTFTYHSDTQYNLMVLFYDKDMNYLSYKNTTTSDSLTAIAPTNACYCNFNIGYGSALSIASASPITVTINGMYALIVKEGNKNLVEVTAKNQSASGVNLVINNDKSVTVNGTSSAWVNILLGNINTKSNLTLSCESVGTSNGNAGIQFYNATKSQQITTLSNGSYEYDNSNGDTIEVWARVAPSVTVSNLTFYPMIRPSGTDDTYVPHESKTTYIPISQPLRSSLDGSVKDEVYRSNGKYIVERKYAYKVYSASNLTLDSDNYNNVTYFTLPKPSDSVFYNKYIKDNGTICNKFKLHDPYGDYHNINNVGKMDTIAAALRIWFGFPKGTTLAEAQAIGDIELQYPLATPTIEDLDQAPFYEMRTFDEVTHIECEAKIEVEYPTSRTAGIASIGFAKGNLADIKMEQLSAQILEVQTALLNV